MGWNTRADAIWKAIEKASAHRNEFFNPVMRDFNFIKNFYKMQILKSKQSEKSLQFFLVCVTS